MKKHIFLLVTVITTLVSCAKYDYDAILEQLRDHEERIQKLETLCTQLNRNVEAIQIVLEALKDNDFITDITKITEGGVEVGYSITFAQSGTINIYHGQSNSEAAVPNIGIRKAQDGEYYWTSDDEWLTDVNGDKIPASVPDDPDGKYITPQFRVAEGIWYISYDGGNTWREMTEPEVEEDAPLFKAVTYDRQYVYLTLGDGNVIKIPIDTSSYTDVPQINNTYIRPKDKDEPIKILCFGSSWFLNTWWYLNKITGNLGINAEIHGYYVGHSCFDEWISLYNNDLTPFAGSESSRGSYRYVSVNGENYTAKRRVSGGEFGDQEFRDAWYGDLISEDWDIIAFQQGAHQAPKWKYWESGPELVSIIRRHCGPNTMIAFNSTWTPSVTSSSLPNDTDGLCSKTLEGQKLWQMMNFDNCKRFMNITGVSNVSPNGAMIYTLRRDQQMNVDGDDLCYDGLHPNYGLPMFAIASVFYETFIAPFYGISIKECSWLPDASDQKGPFNNSVFRPVTEMQRDRIFEYVRLSLSNRFGFNEPVEKDIVIDTENYPTSGTLPLIQHALSVVAGENFYIPSSSNDKRMTSSSTTKATGVFLPAGHTMTLSGISGLRFDYVYSTLPGPNSHNNKVNAIGGVGTASGFVSSNYFPYNTDGSSDSVSFTNTYGEDYFFAFSFAAPNKTDPVPVSDYTITWSISDPDGWTEVRGTEVLNTMPQVSGYVTSASGLVTEYSGYDWSKYDVRVTCRYGGNAAMYAGCFWGENDTYLGGFWKSTGTAKVFNQVILTDQDLPEGVSWSDVVKIGLSSQEDPAYGFRYTTLELRPKDSSSAARAVR